MVFCIEGFGEHGHLKYTKGLWYIYRLIQQPDMSIPMSDLFVDCPADAVAFKEWTEQPALDPQAIKELRSRLVDATEDLKKAKEQNDTVEMGHCQEEIDRIAGQLRQDIGVGGRSRGMNQRSDSLRPTIQSALKTAYKNLRNARPSMSRLSDHFECMISCKSAAYVYDGNEVPHWHTDH